MRAIQITEYGDTSVLTLAETTLPDPQNSQVLLNVRAAALNPLDTVLRSGWMHSMMPLQFPATLGGDVAGVVAAVGPDVTDFAVGDRVYGNAYNLVGNSGALAEQALAAAATLQPIPERLNFVEAAAMPVAGSTAVEAIITSLDVQPGQTVFISGGSGAVGGAAIQLAKYLGATVIATASGDGVRLARDLGADTVIDSTAGDFAAHVSDVDAVFDTVGGDTLERAYGIVKHGGALVAVVGQLDDEKLAAHAIRGVRQARQSADVLERLTGYLADGVITARVGATFPLDEIGAAFEALESRTVRGKILVTP